MRPHKLIMKAFGPFAGETMVDFDAMGSNVYLITGDTGAGKTTIFDAIIYALYGTASGSGRSGLSTEAFHSDYAKNGAHRDEMKVELTFSNSGRTFTVTRTINWGKSGSSKTAQKVSTLYENGSLLVSGKGREEKDDVSAKIGELLGLDADQFRRIIMLAQGEFRKFLEAGSSDRGDILGKLYDNRQHQDLQLRLKAAARLLNERDSELMRRAKIQLENWEFPEDVTPEEKACIGADHPELYSVMDRMIGQMEKAHGEQTDQITEKTEAKRKIEAARTLGEQQNHLLDELENKRRLASELEKKRDSVERIRHLTERAEAAGRVVPSLKNWNQEKKALVRAADDHAKLEEKKAKLAEQEAELSEQKKKTTEENQPKIEKAQADSAALKNILHFYLDLEKSRQEYVNKQAAHKEAADKAVRAEKELEQAKKRQAELTETLERLGNAGDAAVAMAESEVEKHEKRAGELDALKDSLKEIRTLEEEVVSLKKTLLDACGKQTETLKKYDDLNQRFVLGEAGRLAKDLRDRLESGEEQTVRCPVCGCEHTLADIGNFAEYHDKIPTKVKVDQALKAWTEAKDAQSQAESKLTAKRTETELKRAEVQANSRELLDDEVPDVSETSPEENGRIREKIGELLESARRKNEEDLTIFRARLQKAEKERQAKAAALRAKPQAESAVSKAEENRKAASDAETLAKTEEESAATSVRNWRKQLEGYPVSDKDARRIIRDLDAQAKALQQQIDRAAEQVENCRKDKAETEGKAAATARECEERALAVQEAETDFRESLAKQNFADTAAFEAARSPEGVRLNSVQLEKWIDDKKADVKRYEDNCRDTAAAVQTLTESTKGIGHTDVQVLSEQITAAEKELEILQRQERAADGRILRDREIRKQLRKIREQRAGYVRAAEKLRPMAGTANGNLAFSRYVLTDFFHRIVDQANIHLDEMTDGEYCLVPTEEGDARSSLGLGLKVLNTITGIERDTASLSGGQSFEASLSLALGLSDVAQMESTGTIRIDSMFIDEGFGSLDGEHLEKAIRVLEHLSADQRQIGIISHVTRLEEVLQRKIHVIAGEKGSRVTVEVDV